MQLLEIIHPTDPDRPLQHGLDLLAAAARSLGADIRWSSFTDDSPDSAALATDSLSPNAQILVGNRHCEQIAALADTDRLLYVNGAPSVGGFYLARIADGRYVITGGDDNGTLYGCQEFARLLTAAGRLPHHLDHGESPDLALRGPAIGLQKTTVEPDRQTYEYPVTPDRFAWFYDRDLWLEFLDRMFEQRANVVYLWSGHPFASFVRPTGYPEALEVTTEELAANQDLLVWLIDQAARRGIRLMLKFYNIHIPLPFARHHGIPLKQPRPTPLVADYTRAAISDFVTRFPDVGLYVCLGEVLLGDLYGSQWLNDVILPAIIDGAETAGCEPPPILLRAHALDLTPVLTDARQRFPHLRLMTEAKYNGESLTTTTPRGKWMATHQHLAELSDTHIVNVHILANLEPFRYGAVSFIQECVQAMRYRLHAGGLHLYPLFYWEWPYSPDRTPSGEGDDRNRLRQLDRDRIWFEAWHRYAWRCDRDPQAEQEYWTTRLAGNFGSRQTGSAALKGYEALGRIAPQLVRRLGITEGNRQTLSLGMTMGQLINPDRYRAWSDLWESHAPQGERLATYVDREAARLPHLGETPISATAQARRYAQIARTSLDQGWPTITDGIDEYARLCSDAEALGLLAEFYALRVEAAISVMLWHRRQADGEPVQTSALLRAADTIEASVRAYRHLAELTDRVYRYANSMQTKQRKVPFPDGHAFRHWRQCLPEYERELENFRVNIALLAAGKITPGGPRAAAARFAPADFSLDPDDTSVTETFTIQPGASVFTDTDANLRVVAPELSGLTGVRIAKQQGLSGSVRLRLTLPKDAQVLIGYFRDSADIWLRPPDLETDTHADARGGVTPVLRNALTVDFHPRIDVHAFAYEAGTHLLEFGRGAYVLAGVTTAHQTFTGRSVENDSATGDSPDWLFDPPH